MKKQTLAKSWMKWLFLLISFSVSTAKGQIAAWDFNGESSPNTSPADVYNTNLDASNLMTRGSGAGASVASNSFRSIGFQNNGIGTANTDYFEVTLSAVPGKSLSLTTLDGNLNGTSSFAASPGVLSQFAYSLDGTNFVLINSPQLVVGAPQTLTQINLSGISALQNVAASVTITIRYYASGQTTTGGWGFYSASVGSYGLAIGGTINSVCSPPSPTFITAPPSSICANSYATYTTQSGMTAYTWSLPGVSGTDYIITSGGVGSTSNTVTLRWLTTGNKTVTVGYTSGGCASTVPASNTVNITSNATGAPSGAATQSFCVGATVANLSATGTGILWYTTPNITIQTALGSGNTLATGNYYASQTIGGCESGTRFQVAVTVNTSTTSIAPTATQNIPAGANGTALSVTEGSSAVSGREWKYATVSGGPYVSFSPVETGASYTPNFASAGNYYVVDQTTYGTPCNTTITSNEVLINVLANTISTISASYGPFCNGSANNLSVAFSSTGVFSGSFYVQISDASGVFPANSTGNIISAGFATSPITATIPAGYTAGSGYRVRVVNPTPATQSLTNNGSNISISALPAVAAIGGGSSSVCVASTTPAFTNATPGGAWSILAGTGNATITTGGIVTGTIAGTVTVTYTVTSGSCSNTATIPLTVNAKPADPTGSISPGANPACSNTALTYSSPSASIYWQTVVSGTSTTSPSTTPLNVSASGTYYVRAYTGSCWSTNSLSSAAIIVNSPVTITTQPTNKSVTSPNGTSFNVVASNAVSYQWQVDAGSGFVNLTNSGIYSGATSATLTIGTTAENMDGYGYRVLILAASGCTNVFSNTVSLAVAPGPCLSEGFNGGTTAPSGWNFTGIASTYTSAGNYGNASPSVQFSNTGDRIQTTSLANSAAELSFWLKGQSTNATSALLVEGWNGSSWVTIQNITNSIPTTGTTITYNSGTIPSLPAGLTQFRFTYTKGAGNLAFDDVVVKCSQVCTPTATITSLLPSTGPVGTLVTIKGTGFTGATAIKFGGISATTFSVINSSTITAKVPAGALTGKVSVTVGCPAESTNTFGVIGTTGCGSASGTVATDLFISEVYDAVSGSLGYIEVFNGTLNPVSLSNYTIRIRTGTSTDNDFPMSGTLASGSVYILRVGTSPSGICSGFTIQDNNSTASGYNGNDQIFLLKSNVVIDYAPNPNANGAGGTNADAPGFSQVRKNTVTSPSNMYNASQWTNSSSESCSDLGFGPYVPSTVTVNITAQPSDYTSCSLPIQFNANASGSGAGSNSPLWKVYNPVTETWVNASELGISASSFGLYNSITTGATNSLSMNINGNVAQLQNFQFYLEVTRNSTCTTASNAARYNYNTRPYYRSNTASGNWSAPASWQMSNDKVSWVAACSYPIALNSDEVEIQNNQVITLDLDLDIDKVTVSGTGNTGKLIISNSAKMKVLNSQAGADLVVNGVLEDGGSTVNGIDFEDNTGTANDATWQLGPAGTMIKTNGGSSNYRDFYETGISNIPATATWIYRASSASPSTLYVASGTASTTMYYPTLIIESYFAGTSSSVINANPDLSTFAFIGSNNGIIIKKDFNVGGSLANAGKVNFSNLSSFAPVQVLGNTTILAGNTLNNTGNANGAGTGFEFQGNLVNDGTLRSKLYPANGSSGKLWFTGASSQSVSGGGTFDLHNMRVNKTALTLTLNTNLRIPDSLTLVNGVVNTSASGLLTLGTTTNTVYGSPGSSAYVNGPMAKEFADMSTDEFIYPIGKSTATTVYNPAGVVGANITGTTTFVAEYFQGAHQANAVMGNNVVGISDKEYWNISKTPANASTARVKIMYNNPGPGHWIYYNASGPFYSNVPDPCLNCNVAVVHRSSSTNTWDFTSTPSMFSTALPEYRYNTDYNFIYSAPLSAFSPFTIGYSFNIILTLPVKLLSFSGTLVTADGKLAWSVADTKDLSGFELEYSTDGLTFHKLADVAPNGNSTNFSFLHKDLPPGTNFYRLLVKDKSGKQFYSQVVLLRVGKLKTYVIGLSPTVVTDQVMPVIFSAERQEAEGMITDVLGRRIVLLHQRLEPGANQWRIQTGSLARGTYFLSIITKDGLKETRRFIKE